MIEGDHTGSSIINSSFDGMMTKEVKNEESEVKIIGVDDCGQKQCPTLDEFDEN